MFGKKKTINWWEKYDSHKYLTDEEVCFCGFFTEDGFNKISSGLLYDEIINSDRLLTLKNVVSMTMYKLENIGYKAFMWKLDQKLT